MKSRRSESRQRVGAAAPGQVAPQPVSKAPRFGLRGSVVRNPEQREEQRQQILAAAARVFARQGYDRTTMDDIAAEMGGSKGILYYQFQSKQDLIVETRRATSGGAAERLEAIAARPLPPLERMELAVSDLIATNFNELSRHVILTSVTLGLDKPHAAKVRTIERRYEKALIGLIEEGMASGVFASGNAKVVALTIIQTCLSPARWYREGKGASANEVAGIVSDMVMRSLRPLSSR